jgi:hypothetical protein
VAQVALSGLLRSVNIICGSAVLAAALAAAPAASLAQGGPPLVTDDPDTPGGGRWEINLATIAMHTRGRWDLAAPDADLNYGCGDHVQLTADIPWALVHDVGSGWNGGLGNVQLGLKWRFLEWQDLGLRLSTFPKFSSAWVQSSRRRGIADPGHDFLLPLEAATKLGTFGLDAEVARDFITGAASHWQFGAIAEHSCGGTIQCMLELRETLIGHDGQTLINLGVHWKLSESVAFIGAAGREFGRADPDQQQALVYLGIQLLR